MPTADYLLLMAQFYALTVLIETVVLVLALSRRHPVRVRVFAGVWLTACTYPVVWLVLPTFFEDRWTHLLVAETFAPVAECGLFWFGFLRGLPLDRAFCRDMAAIVLANLTSFATGELLHLLLRT